MLAGGGGESGSTRFLGTSTTGTSLPTGEASSDKYKVVSGFLTLELRVSIDIKPGSYPNTIKLGSMGSVPVAILSSEDFDARTVDPTSVTLATASVKIKPNGSPMASLEDVNEDGFLDLMVHVSTGGLKLSETATEAALEAKTSEGAFILGLDTVKVLP